MQACVACPGQKVNLTAWEDGGTVTAQLPPSLEADEYRSVCYPGRADYFSISNGGLISYRPRKGAFSGNPRDRDSFLAVGIRKSEDGSTSEVVTPYIEIKVYIRPVNHAPVIAGGADHLVYNHPDTLVNPNNILSEKDRLKLTSPFSLVGEVSAEDPDGDRLTFKIASPPKNGTAYLQSANEFFYVPNPGFMGMDIFVVEVDDGRGGGSRDGDKENRPLTSHTEIWVQVGEDGGIPTQLPQLSPTVVAHSGLGNVKDASPGETDDAIISTIERTSTLNTDISSNLRYELTELPTKGSVQFLCDGKEVFSVTDCQSDSFDDDSIEPQVYYKYTPNPDAEGADAFKFAMRVADQSHFKSSNGSISLNVLRINQAPTSYNGTVSIDLFYDVEPFVFGGNSSIRLNATDSDNAALVALVDLRWLWSGAGEFFVPTHSGEDHFRSIHDVVTWIDDVPWGKVDVVDGEAVLVFQPTANLAGSPVLQILYKLFDGELYSDLAAVDVSIKCPPGYHTKLLDEEEHPDIPLGDLHSCAHCPPGTMSYIENQLYCTRCGLGTFSTGGASDCTWCPSGSYQDQRGSGSCIPCPRLSFSEQASESIDDCYCTKGSYGESGSCQECPNDKSWVDCSTDGLLMPRALSGYTVFAEESIFAHVRACIPPEACASYNRNLNGNSTGFTGVASSIYKCNEGYDGFACRKCGVGYYRSVAHCEKCPSALTIAVYWLAYLIVISLPKIASARGPTHWLVLHQFVTFVHPLGLMARFHIEWPERFRNYFKVISVLYMNPDILFLECVGPPFHPLVMKWWILMMLPVVAALVSLLAGIVRNLSDQTSNKLVPGHVADGEPWRSNAEDQEVVKMLLGRPRKNLHLHPNWRSHAWELFLVYCLYLQVPVSTGALMLFDCSKDDTTGEYYLEVDPSVQCFTTSGLWSQLAAPGIFCVCIYVLGMPIMFAAILRSVKRTRSSDKSPDKCCPLILSQFHDGKEMQLLVPILSSMTISCMTLGGSLDRESEVLKMFGTILILMACLHIHERTRALKVAPRVAISAHVMMGALQTLGFFAIAAASPVLGLEEDLFVFIGAIGGVSFLFLCSWACLGPLVSSFCKEVECAALGMWLSRRQQYRAMKTRKLQSGWRLASAIRKWRAIAKEHGLGNTSQKGSRTEKILRKLDEIRNKKLCRREGRFAFDSVVSEEQALDSAELSMEALAQVLAARTQNSGLDVMSSSGPRFSQEQVLRWFRHMLAYYKSSDDLNERNAAKKATDCMHAFEDGLNPSVRSIILEQMSRKGTPAQNWKFAALMERIQAQDPSLDGDTWHYGEALREEYMRMSSSIDACENNMVLDAVMSEQRFSTTKRLKSKYRSKQGKSK